MDLGRQQRVHLPLYAHRLPTSGTSGARHLGAIASDANDDVIVPGKQIEHEHMTFFVSYA